MARETPSVHNGILATKLHVPQLRLDWTPRPRLAARLAAGLAGRLTLVAAPAGFGKTTLLADWIQRSGLPAAWLSLDPDDDDEAQFLRYVVAALQTVVPSLEATLQAMLQLPQPAPFPALLTMLINDLTALRQHCVLVLDDYHVLKAPRIHESVAFLLDHLPAQLHLIITTREDPPLPIARLRARRQLTELRAADLRFTSEEAAAFLNDVMGLNLLADKVAALDERTEGWIAGLQLAALSMQGRQDVTSFIAAFTGSHRYITDYLGEEVVSRQPEHIVNFLLQTSVLNRLSGSLCQAVTGLVDSQALLEKLEQANLFLAPLDNERRWYRYHPLFAELLQARLHQSQPASVPLLHHRAAGWYERAGLVPDAIHHALAGDDLARAVRLILKSAEQMVSAGEFARLLRWLDALPRAVLQSHPRLLLIRAWIQFLVEPYGAEAVESLLRQVEAALPQFPATGNERVELRGMAAAIRSSVAGNQEDRPRATTLAQEALSCLPPDNLFWRIIPTMNLGLAHDAGGDVAEASRWFAEAQDMARRAGSDYVALIATIHLGRVRAKQGSLRAAAALYRDALALAARHGWQRLPMVGLPHVWLAKVLYEWNDLAGARQHVDEGLQPVQFNEHRRILLEAYATLGRIHAAKGDWEGVQEAMSRAAAAVQPPAMQWAAPRVAAYAARAWLAQGRLDQAVAWSRQAGLREDDELSGQREYEHITLARVLLAQKEPAEALPGLRRLAQAAETAGRLGSLVEILVLQALALQAKSDTAAAIGVLDRVLALAQPEGYVRIFVDEGAPMAALLRRMMDRAAAPVYVARLLAACLDGPPPEPGQDDVSSSVRCSAPLVEPLTRRELEVMQLIALGRSNAEIAEALVLALPTVKRHISNIYGKLEVTTRVQAAARARELGLL